MSHIYDSEGRGVCILDNVLSYQLAIARQSAHRAIQVDQCSRQVAVKRQDSIGAAPRNEAKGVQGVGAEQVG
jgi:hypothetical protein